MIASELPHALPVRVRYIIRVESVLAQPVPNPASRPESLTIRWKSS